MAVGKKSIMRAANAGNKAETDEAVKQVQFMTEPTETEKKAEEKKAMSEEKVKAEPKKEETAKKTTAARKTTTGKKAVAAKKVEVKKNYFSVNEELPVYLL